jgi:hypothetical protein
MGQTLTQLERQLACKHRTAQWESCGEAGQRIVDKSLKPPKQNFHQQSILPWTRGFSTAFRETQIVDRYDENTVIHRKTGCTVFMIF